MALWRDGVAAGRAGDAAADPRSHAERLPLEATAFLAGQELTFRQVDAFIVIAGPGSFTGLRVGVAAAQGWAMALGRQVHTVPTLDALAYSVAANDAIGATLVPCVDGLRGEVFFGVWCDGTEIVGPQVGSPADVVAAVSAAHHSGPIVITGDGATKYADAWRTAGWTSVVPAMCLAESAARIVAAGGGTAGTPHAVRLNYVRRTDAEIVRERGGRRA